MNIQANKLVIFRDNGAFHNIPQVSDRALLRLGHALSELKQWDASRQAFETLVAMRGVKYVPVIMLQTPEIFHPPTTRPRMPLDKNWRFGPKGNS